MFKNLLNAKTNSISYAALILGAASLVSRLAGLVRDRIFAHQFGAGDTLDAYYAAFRIPDTMYNLIIIGAISAGFIPLFLEHMVKNKDDAFRFTNIIITLTGMFLLVGCGLLFIFAPSLMRYVAPGFSGEKLHDTIMLTRIMLVSPILLGISSIIGSALQAMKSFVLYSIAPVFYNVGIIVGTLLFVPLFGLRGLAYGVILGAFLHLLIQIPAIYKEGFRFRPRVSWKDPSVKKLGILMIPRILSLASAQVNLFAITIIASLLAAGSISIFNFANNLQYVPVGLIGTSFALAAFPTLSAFIAEHNIAGMKAHLIATIHRILFFIIPLTVLFILLRAQIVRVILGSGAFDWNDTVLTADTLALFSLSLFAQAIVPLLARGFYAMKNTWIPFIIALVSSGLNVILSIALKDTFGVRGLAFAFSVAMIVQMILLWLALRHFLSSLQEKETVRELFKLSIAAFVMGGVVQFAKQIGLLVDMTKFWGVFTQAAIASILGVAAYCLISYLLKVTEMRTLFEKLRRRQMLDLKPSGMPVEDTTPSNPI